jgi:hypothetical protein
MSITKTVITKIVLLLAFLGIMSLYAPMALADNCGDNCSSNNRTPTASSSSSTPGGDPACQNTSTAPALKKCVTQSPLVQDIQKIINFLAAGVGIVVIGVIILGGIQYSIAGDNAQATGAAKQRIVNGLIALVAFIFAFAFLNWLLPGGAFG